LFQISIGIFLFNLNLSFFGDTEILGLSYFDLLFFGSSVFLLENCDKSVSFYSGLLEFGIVLQKLFLHLSDTLDSFFKFVETTSNTSLL
jgi:hypothetical protein